MDDQDFDHDHDENERSESEKIPALTKADMAERLASALDIPKRDALPMVEQFFDRIHAELLAGRDVKLPGFGSFEVRSKVARPGRNPRTGEPAVVQARQVVSFRASSKLKSAMNPMRSAQQ